MNKGWRRIVSTTVAIVFVMTSVLVCAPPVVSAPEGHCKPAAGMKAGCSHCPQKNVMDCCATSAPQPAVPQDGQPQQASGAAAAAWAAHADAVFAPATLNALFVAKAVRAAPPHGYRSTDLPILNAVFLI
jgi:hypothetical protein